MSLASSGALIGDVAIRASDADVPEAELGFTFAAAHQGQGYATEAVGVVVQYGFEQLAMRRLFSWTDARNVRAQRLLDRLGFRRDGEIRERVWFKGAWATDLRYARFVSEWPPERTD